LQLSCLIPTFVDQVDRESGQDHEQYSQPFNAVERFPFDAHPVPNKIPQDVGQLACAGISSTLERMFIRRKSGIIG